MHLRPETEVIPGYRLQKFLGKGQFGEVWRATGPGQIGVALKFIDLRGKEGWKEYRGIQRVKAIRHAHLMPMTAVWLLDATGNTLRDSVPPNDSATPRDSVSDSSLSVDGTMRTEWTATMAEEPSPAQWLVVAMVLGEQSLSERLEDCLKQGLPGIPVEELLDNLEEAAKGIDFLNSPKHDLGQGPVSIQHCDIKPDNIMLVGGSVLICDYGMARVLSDQDQVPTSTWMGGSPAYMAPECIAGRQPSSTTDQYSLAISYFQLRTGGFPFSGRTHGQVLEAHATGRLSLAALPPAERAVIRRATALSPAARFASATEMVQHLRRAAQQPYPTDRERSSRTHLVVGIAVGVSLFATALIGWSLFGGRATVPPSPNPDSAERNRDDPSAVSSTPDQTDPGPVPDPGRVPDPAEPTSNGRPIPEGSGTDPTGLPSEPPPSPQTLTLRVSPPQVQIQVDGRTHEVSPDGELVLSWQDEPIDLHIDAPDHDYQDLKQTLDRAAFAAGILEIQLPRSTSYWIRQAEREWLAGQATEAVAAWRETVALDPQYRWPVAIHSAQAPHPIRWLARVPQADQWYSADLTGALTGWRIDAAAAGAPRLKSELIGETKADDIIERLAVSEDGAWAVTGGWGQAWLWSLTGDDVVSPQALQVEGADITAVAIDSLSRWAATGDAAGQLRLFQLPDLQRLDSWPWEGGPQTVFLEFRGPRQIVSLHEEGSLRRLEIDEQQKRINAVDAVEVKQRITAAVLLDTDTLLLGTESGSIERWSLEPLARREDDDFPNLGDAVTAVAVSRDGRHFAVGNEKGQVFVFVKQAETFVQTRHLQMHKHHPVRCLAFSDTRPNAKSPHWLAAGGWAEVLLCDLNETSADTDSQQPLRMSGHTQAVRAVAFSAQFDHSDHSAWLATAGDDGWLRFWNLTHCALIQGLPQPSEPTPDQNEAPDQGDRSRNPPE